MKFSMALLACILLNPLIASQAGDEADFQVGFKLSLDNQTDDLLTGFVYLELINNNKHPLTIAPRTEFVGYVGKLSDNLTEGEKSIIAKAGQAIGAAGSAYAGSKDIELPTGTADASGDIATAILSWFNTCIKGFSVVYRGNEYWYKFGNGCTDQEFTLRPENRATELRIYDKNGNVDSWGSVKRVSPIKAKL